jgi:hypothetical protein
MTHRTEKDELRLILGLARQLGMTCCSTQQFRGSKQFEGLPDYWIFDPKKPHIGGYALGGGAFWWEGKAVNGKQSLAQYAFRQLCFSSNVCYGIGTFADFCVFLTQWRGKAPTIPLDCEKWGKGGSRASRRKNVGLRG